MPATRRASLRGLRSSAEPSPRFVASAGKDCIFVTCSLPHKFVSIHQARQHTSTLMNSVTGATQFVGHECLL